VNGFDPATLDFYANEAPIYAASGANGVARHLPPFLQRLTPDARILELGCGGGRDAQYMLAQGFDVDATDGTAEIAAQAEIRLCRSVRVMRFDELDSVGEYDAVVASASLLHVPRPALSDIIHRIWMTLKPGGWHIASFKGGGTEGRDRFGRYFNYLDAEELRACYTDASDWTELEILSGMGGGYDGLQGPWHIITVQKYGSDAR
jgi:SAM-dependent methyltransferase